MAWIKIHSEFLDSWKVAEVCESLNIGEAQAIGHIVSLWCFTERNAWQNGDLTRWKPLGVAKAARWPGKPAAFVEAFQKAALLDPDSLVVHEWTKHQASMIHDRENRKQFQGKGGGSDGVNTGKSPEKPRAREDEIRGEKIRGGESARPRGIPFQIPDINKVKEYAATLGQPAFPARKFMNHYEANGWMVGRVPMRDWQAAVRSWLEGSAAAGSALPPGGAPARSGNLLLDEIAERKRQQALEEKQAADEAAAKDGRDTGEWGKK